MNASGSDQLPTRLLLSVDEVGSLLGAKRTFVFALLASGQLPSCRLGRLRKIAYADLASYVEHLRTEADAECPRDGDHRQRGQTVPPAAATK